MQPEQPHESRMFSVMFSVLPKLDDDRRPLHETAGAMAASRQVECNAGQPHRAGQGAQGQGARQGMVRQGKAKIMQGYI